MAGECFIAHYEKYYLYYCIYTPKGLDYNFPCKITVGY